MQQAHHYLRAIAVGLSVFLLDFITKAFVFRYIPLMGHGSMWYPFGGIGVFQDFFGIDFSINHYTNKGAAWGTFADFQMHLLVLRIVLIIGMCLFVAFFNKRPNWDIPMAMIIAGATGNVLDFFIYGHVIDMFHFIFWGYEYPVFNIADASIFIGIAWLLISSWRDKSYMKNHA